MESLLADLRHAIRVLRQSSGFTLIAIAVIALGIGANTAIFTVVNAVLLHPLPYPHSERIVNVNRGGGNSAIPMFTYWLQQPNLCLDDLAAYDSVTVASNLSGGDRPELIRGIHVSVNYFRLFGAAPIAGRVFTAAEDRPGGMQVLLMSYGLWQRRFGGDASVIGKTLDLAGAPYSVIGILSPAFRPNPGADVWLPLQADPSSDNQAHTLQVSGRLRRGATLRQASSQMRGVGRRYVQSHPQPLGNDDDLRVTPMQQSLTGDVQPALFILLGAVGLVLLIACANVANLLLARAAGRQKEIAIRAAIGAGRLRLVRQLLTESMILAMAGAIAGLTLGSWGVRALLKFTPGNLPRAEELAAAPSLDPAILGFTLGLAMLTGILFGMVPAIQTSRSELASALKESSGRSGTGFRHNRMRAVLAVSEMALAVVLLCCALLLIRSFILLHNVQPGFEGSHVLTLQVSVAGQRYATAAKMDQFGRRLSERLEKVPGVQGAALVSSLPTEMGMDMIFNIPGRPLPKEEKFHGDVQWRFVTSRYFEVLNIPLRTGRQFRDPEPGPTVIVNSAFARKFWPKESPLGKQILIGAGLPGFEQGLTEIVGVVGDVREGGLDSNAPPVMYQPYIEISDRTIALLNSVLPATFLVRSRPGVAPMSLSAPVQHQFLTGDGQLAPSKVRTMDQVMLDSTARQNFNLLLLGVFAAIALALAAIGIYGVMSYSVEQRTHEMGIRSALGAGRTDTIRLVVGQGMRLAMIGVAAGLLAAFALTRLVSSLLFGIQPSDPATFAGVACILVVVALFATGIPALRATKIDPIIALRYE